MSEKLIPVLSRKVNGKKQIEGVLVSYCESRHCPIEDCRGQTVCVRWPDGSHTYPCTAGMAGDDDIGWEIQ